MVLATIALIQAGSLQLGSAYKITLDVETVVTSGDASKSDCNYSHAKKNVIAVTLVFVPLFTPNLSMTGASKGSAGHAC